MITLQQLGTAFFIGILATSSPCVFPLYPGFLAYLSSNSQRLRGKSLNYLLGPLVLMGVLTMMLLIGFIVASLSLAMGSVLAVATPLVDILIILLGILLLLNINPFIKLAQMRMPLLSNPFISAYVYGLLFGPVLLPCSGLFATGVFALSFSVSQFWGKMVFFLAFGLGLGIPLLVISFLSQIRGGWLTRFFASRHALMNRIAGIILILLGVLDLRTNLPALQLYF
ncbi:MAG: hypothetical protein HY730_01930 [Candidatus Tectomicrobia bacterium]|uniref:Cytochrome C biogenesis protein transmembrane domain-containing protein n=1 Tax=Tectimicrobiota bacterium TaxID=2528274 RepID=A0A933GJQ1_UNCTE|nr:hypothetical protein [Candidatus Tectomicrobia bacterium]